MQLSVSSTTAEERFARDVREGLAAPGQKRLPAEYFYDELGSALFEAITVLPEYGLTRADRRLLSRHAKDIATSIEAPVAVLELGSGSGAKTAHLLRELSLCQPSLDYYPIDVSGSALEHCRLELAHTASVHPIEATFVEGVRAARRQLPENRRILLLFLGSTIGNFGPDDAIGLLRELRAELNAGDRMLIGADLLKPVHELIEAYDDPAGVTAAFNLNVLGRINRELGGNFDLRQFHHEARYDAGAQRIEMHLVAKAPQAVTIPGADCTIRFDAGESIWTESSHKYELAQLAELARAGGFRVLQSWVDHQWPFAECLWEAE